jgi:hypothetical protein
MKKYVVLGMEVQYVGHPPLALFFPVRAEPWGFLPKTV